MTQVLSKRVESIDILRGLVMVIMALDHVRDYYHFNALAGNFPENLETTTISLFFTRFITHYCAPVFVFLAGTSAYLYGAKRTSGELSKFLITRGIWLIIVEIILNNFLWWFDISFGFTNLQVIWAIGFSMIVLGGAIHLPKRIILVVGLLIVLGHNMLDGITFEGRGIVSVLWNILHHPGGFSLSENHFVWFAYPVLPWIGVMLLGYCFGSFYKVGSSITLRKKWLLYLGVSTIVLFFILRTFNIYGDSAHWIEGDTITKTIVSFFKVSKYPPSLLFLLITLGPAFLFLYAIEKIKNKVTDFLLVFGRVPFFYYILHILFVHLGAIIGLLVTGKDWKLMIFDSNRSLSGYGYSLFTVYIIWIVIIAVLYPFCKRYMRYKANNKDKWWLSYL